MAALSHQDSRRMYSWWWDSHISPKNSRWLQENLTDMDAKVKGMIKLINEDADSFARRAEMYYKKRPELMKFVEEFYRAYRALAERYDHATGVIRHAHRTMAEAFPNQVSLGLGDDSPAGSDPQTPELTPMRGFFEPEELQKDALGDSAPHTHDLKSNGAFTDESHSVTKRKGLKQRNELFGSGDQGRFADGRVRKGLDFSETEEKGAQTNESSGFQARALPDSERLVESEEILTLKKAITQVEAEKEAGLIQYQQTLEKLSQLESEISRAKEDSQGFGERASKAEAEAQTLKEALSALAAEKEANLQQYQTSLDRISELENTISHAQENTVALDERARKAELEAQSLRDDLTKVAAEKDEALKQYMQSLEMIAKLENKLQCAEEDVRKLTERAEKAESEVESFKQEILKLTGEKEAAALQLQQCLETISSLEQKLSCAQEEAQRLNAEISDGVAKLEDAEEHRLLLERSNKSLHSELESLTLKMGTQSQELTEKQKELGRVWTCVQEERLRFVEAETAFQTLQHLHAKSQEEMRALALELQNRVQVLKDLETHNQTLEGEVQKVKEENINLNEINVSSAISMRDMENEISSLRDEKGKLKVEVELRVDQRNALQQEIYCLKEELNNQNKKLLSIVTQVQAMGFDSESFESSVKELQDEKSNLKESCDRERSEKVALLEKLKVLEELLEKNTILENSLSDLSAELEAVRGNLKALEDSCQSLLEEKSALLNDKATLTSELQVTVENLEKVSAKNTILENSLSDAHVELQSLKVKTNSLEDSSEVLVKEKADLALEKESLISQLQAAQVALDDLEGRYSGLEQRHSALEKERGLTLDTLEELRIFLDAKNCEHVRFVHMSEARLAGMESNMHLLQEECQLRKQEFDDLLEKAMESNILNCTLQTSVRGLEGKSSSLLSEYQKLFEAYIFSKTLIADLKQKNVEQKMETASLFDQVNILRNGIFKLLKALDIAPHHVCHDKKDQVHLEHIFHGVEVAKGSFYKAQEENHQRAIQMNVLVTLLEQLKLEVDNLVAEKTIISQESSIKSEQLLALQSEVTKLEESSEELKLKITEKDHRGGLLEVENCNLAKALQLAEDELKTVRSMRDQLNLQVIVGKNLLSEKDIELQGMEQKLYLTETEKSVLHQILKNLSGELIGSKMIVEDQEKKILKLCADSNRLSTENAHLFEARQLLQEGLHQSRGELAKLKMQEEALHSELQKQLKEIETWKLEMDALLGELQVSLFYHILYEQKAQELSEACQSFDVQISSKDKDIKLLKEKVSTLGTENEDLNTQLTAYGPAIFSLSQCISSLENHSYLHRKLQKPDTEDTKDIVLANPVGSTNLEDNENAVATNAFSDLHGLEIRVRAVEKALAEMGQLVVQENLDKHSKLQAAMEQIEKLESSLHKRNLAPKSEISEPESGTLTKDIMLDHVSECSPYRIGSKKQAETNNLVFDLWDTTNPTIGKAKMDDTPNAENDFDFHKRVPSLKKKRQHAASDVLSEKDSGEGKLNTSKRSTESIQEGNKRKVLERLDSDVQKLTNLQITVQDLKRELEITEKGKRGKAVAESEILKGQLNEAEAAIHKLFDLTGNLMKNMEESFGSNDMKSALESEEIGNVSRRRISEQVRRISEKIGRLQLEVQQLQFVLVKLNDQSKGNSRFSETNRRVLLRDYLYGGVRKSNRRKRAPFCACIQPPTQGD